MNMALFLKRYTIFFYLSFFSAGTQNILTQMFLKNNYPQYKEILLPVTLILGALAYICGIYFSNKYLITAGYLIKFFFILNIVSFIFLMVIKQVLLYIIFYIIACFCCNFIFNFCDHYLIKRTGTGLSQHIKTILVFQLLAYIISPLFFALNSHKTILSVGVILLLSVFVGLLSIKNCNFQEKVTFTLDEGVNSSQKPFDLSDQLFVLYIVIFFSLVNMATSLLTYFVSEYYMFQNYALKTGLLLMLMSACAGAAVVAYRSPSEKAEGYNVKKLKHSLFRPKLQIAIISVYLLMVYLLLIKLSNSFIYIAVILCIMGLGHGLFLSSSRKFASTVSIRNGNPRLLSLYNNLQSIALLVGYSISTIIWEIARAFKFNYYPLVIISFLIMLIIEILIICLWVWNNRITLPKPAIH